MLTTFDDNILYVGLTKKLHERFKQHLDNPEKTNPTADGKTILFYFYPYEEKHLQMLERTWLNQYQIVHGANPILNKVNSPVS